MSEPKLTPSESEMADTGRTITARVDVFERDDEYVVNADMPGVAAEDVDIRFENGELTLLGRRSSTNANRERVHQEYDVSGYRRSFRIADHVAGDRIEASLNQGVLTLRLPKTESVKPRRIAVKV